ncbi:FAD-binding and (Fe-S)-binding domain-containing protein [Hwanghaeella sp.]|uniref:FAD-binding and (Fe-S)-binding domain-containing protein n=1 Tax=Hwanghaeella sp. TaxID=2605943 RepID=UPI003CCC1E4F
MGFVAGTGLGNRLKKEISGDILLDAFSRGRYATDASIYQMMPLGVVVPKTVEDIQAAIAAARDEGLPVLARGGGTSQCGQTVNNALVIDNSKYFNGLIDLDVEGQRCLVRPGIVLDELNRLLKPHGLWFPVDVSTSSRATIGGMTGNNSCGSRSIRYGTMRDNVHSIEGLLADGQTAAFGAFHRSDVQDGLVDHPLAKQLLNLGAEHAEEISRRFPNLMRRVGGYNIDALVPMNMPNNLSHLLVGSEGTLAYSTAIELKLSPLPRNKTLGVCHFGSFYHAMDATQHLVKLAPQAVELVDATMINLAKDIPMFRATVDQFIQGEPDALLLVEFAEESPEESLRKLAELETLMGDLGFSWTGSGKSWGGVVRAEDPAFQSAIWEVRKSGLNIMMSMKEEGKPVSFVEDCAVPLEDLADYTARLTDIFTKHGTTGTWYAHASVGCLHVRPILNMKTEQGAKTMRAIAEEAFEMVREYKGSHSGEHGDGIVRSEFHEPMFGSKMVEAFREVKQLFDPETTFNPGKIVDPPKMDDRSLFRFPPDYRKSDHAPALDWSEWPGGAGGFQGAIEMCNNNGACRKLSGGVMCPSFRVTRNERDLTRGRANTLRLALSGQLGPDAMTSDDMAETMKLCVSCKGCKRECPTGVDMARMKIEVLAARAKAKGLSLHDKLVGYLPRYAPMTSKFPWLANLRNTVPGLAKLMEGPTGFAADRKLPAWRSDRFENDEVAKPETVQAVLFADTFNRYFEPENLRATTKVLKAAGIGLEVAAPKDGGRPLCCGRTFLAVGLVEEARAEAQRLLDALYPYAEKGIPIVGLEPSCLLTLRDEIPALLPGEKSAAVAAKAKMLEEYLTDLADQNALSLPLKSPAPTVKLHGHCHQKAFGVVSSIQRILQLLPDTKVETIETSCCGMAGSFGYKKETQDISKKMAELSLLPAVRDSGPDTVVVADGTSCRHQIFDGSGKDAIHVARLLEMALDD